MKTTTQLSRLFALALAAAGVAAAEPGAYQLHSLPGATKTIYLDFNGHTTEGAYWNTRYTGGAPIVSAPFVADDAFIRRVWERVAEDYAPFAVNVTTEEPDLEALRKTAMDDVHYIDQINALMASHGSPHQLTPCDLSGFTNFST